MYLLQLTGLDDRGVTVLVVGQAKQDVVADCPLHDPGGLRWEGDATAVADFALRRHQLSEDQHEQGTLEENGKKKEEKDGLYPSTILFCGSELSLST